MDTTNLKNEAESNQQAENRINNKVLEVQLLNAPDVPIPPKNIRVKNHSLGAYSFQWILNQSHSKPDCQFYKTSPWRLNFAQVLTCGQDENI